MTYPGNPETLGHLPSWRRPLAVVAHPDDESFGLGALLASFVHAGSAATVLCFTHGEASTLHGVDGDLREVRAGELSAAAALLGLRTVALGDEPDGALGAQDRDRLAKYVIDVARNNDADGLVVFDPNGVTGHPDHRAATSAAVAAAAELDLPVLAWVLPVAVTEALRNEYGVDFHGRTSAEIDLAIPVNREHQLRAVAAHPSQAVPGSVLWRRLELLGELEYLTFVSTVPHEVGD